MQRSSLGSSRGHGSLGSLRSPTMDTRGLSELSCASISDRAPMAHDIMSAARSRSSAMLARLQSQPSLSQRFKHQLRFLPPDPNDPNANAKPGPKHEIDLELLGQLQQRKVAVRRRTAAEGKRRKEAAAAKAAAAKAALERGAEGDGSGSDTEAGADTAEPSRTRSQPARSPGRDGTTASRHPSPPGGSSTRVRVSDDDHAGSSPRGPRRRAVTPDGVISRRLRATLKPRMVSTWSPLKEYTSRLSRAGKINMPQQGGAMRSAAFASTTNNAALPTAPSFSMPRARRDMDRPKFVTPSAQHYGDVATSMDKLSKSKSAPSFSIGTKLKNEVQIAEDLGYGPSSVPAPGGSTNVPSFVVDNLVEGKGVVFGKRLKSRVEIMEALGYPIPPAPGGDYRIPSFVHEAKVGGKGVPFGVRLKSRREMDEALGVPEPAFWPESMKVPSFTEHNQEHRRGVVFGHKLLSPRSILRAIGYPEPPARGATGELLSFADEAVKQGRGVIMGKRLPSPDEIALKLGRASTLAPGGETKVPSFADEAKSQSKGTLFGERFRSRMEIDMALGTWSRLAPGGTYRIPSFTHDNKVVFGSRLKSRDEILRAIGYPTPPAPGGNCEVPSFVADDQAQRKGVKFGHRIPPLSEKFITPAPGGNTKVPSFAREDTEQGRGVKFGHKLKSEQEIAEKLGRWSRLGPGGSTPVPSFVREDQHQRKGVVFGHRFPDPLDKAKDTPGAAQYDIAKSTFGTRSMSFGVKHKHLDPKYEEGSPGPKYQTAAVPDPAPKPVWPPTYELVPRKSVGELLERSEAHKQKLAKTKSKRRGLRVDE